MLLGWFALASTRLLFLQIVRDKLFPHLPRHLPTFFSLLPRGSNLEQSLIASGVNGCKWVGCGGKPHIPANCTNAQEANCQFDGMLSLSN